MVNYNDSDNIANISISNPVISVPTHGLFDEGLESSPLYIEIYKDRQSKELLFASDNVMYVDGSMKIMNIDLAFSKKLDIDPFIIVIGVVGKFNKKILIRRLR